MTEVHANVTEVIERMDEGFFALDDEWRFTLLNETAAEVLNGSRDQLIGEVVWDEFEAAVDTTFQREYERAMAEREPVSFEEYYPPLETWFEVTAYPDEDGLSVYFRDVTDRIERERDLERYESIVETARDGIYVVDEEGRFRMVNESYATLTGYDSEELLGSHVSLVVDEEAIDAAGALEHEPKSDDRSTTTLEATIRRADGETRVAEITLTRLPGGDRVGAVRDVTERKEREAELERTRELLERAERIAEVGGWEIDPETRDVFWTEHLFDMLGVDYDEEPPLDEALDIYLEEDRRTVENAIETAIEEFELFDVEARFQRSDNEVRWLRLQGVPTVEDGEITMLRGTAQDVTERKSREQRLERYEQVIATVDDGIYALNDGGEFLMVNDAFCRLSGYGREELIGQHATIVKDEQVMERADRLTEELAAGEREQATIEFEIERKDGERIPVESRIGEFPVDDGIGRCSVVRNMADWKTFERRLVALHGVARDLLRAESDEEIARIATNALQDILDAPAAGYFRYDPDADRLVPDTVSDGSVVLKDDLPVVSPGEGLTGTVFERRETRLLDDVQEAQEYEVQEAPAYEKPDEGIGVKAAVLSSIGDYGVLAAGSPEAGVFDDETDELIEIVSTASEAAFSRIEREQQLRMQVDQQAVVTALGRRALADQDLDSLMSDAARLVAGTLDADYCKVLDLDAEREELLLRQGVGWDEGTVGSATVSAVDDSQAAYTLASEEPVAVGDLDDETRFSGPDLLTDHDVQSGVSTVIGPADDPWGILGVHDTERREFSEQTVNFVQSVANVLAAAITRHEDEAALRSQRDRLSALNDINSLVQSLSESMFGLSTRDEIEELVCKRLAASDSYEFAWIGTADGDEVTCSTEAGVENYLENLTLTLDGDGEAGPTARTYLTGEMRIIQNVQEDPRYEPWREHAREYGYSSSAAIPLVDGGDLQGTLNLYSSRSDAFGEEERDALRRLGSIIAYAFSSVDRERELQRERNRLEFMNRLLRHNLLNSLNVVKARLNLLDGQVDYEVSGHLETAAERTQEMIQFVETVREMTKVLGRDDEREHKPRAIEDVLQDRVEHLRRSHPNAEFRMESIPEADVMADDLFGEVIDNVLVNAVQHNPSERPTVWVDAIADEETVEVIVADDGPGIPDERKSRVFGREANGFDDPGSGFGLYLVEEIIDSYGGDITVEDNDPEGTRFRLTFRRA